MSTPTTIAADLMGNLKVPDPLTRNLNRKELRCLPTYINHALELPTTEIEVAKHFSLDTSMQKKLQKHIKASAQINNDLREHCLNFQQSTFNELRKLLRTTKSYALRSQQIFPILFDSITQLIDAKHTGSDTTDPLKAVGDMADNHIKVTTAILAETKAIEVGLQEFGNQMATDSGTVGRQIKDLNQGAEEIGQGTSGRLTTAVESLKEFVSICENRRPSAQQPPVWMGLIGLIPQDAVKTPAAMACLKEIRRLSSSKDEQDILERASLTCKMMTSYWHKINEVLQPAKKAIRAIEGSFQAMMADLEFIKSNADNLLTHPAPIKVKDYTDTWVKVYKGVDDLIMDVSTGDDDEVDVDVLF